MNDAIGIIKKYHATAGAHIDGAISLVVPSWLTHQWTCRRGSSEPATPNVAARYAACSPDVPERLPGRTSSTFPDPHLAPSCCRALRAMSGTRRHHAFDRSRPALTSPIGRGSAAFPPLTLRQMKFRTERLGRLYSFTIDQVADLAGWQPRSRPQLRRFDPTIASRTTFMKGVMNLWSGRSAGNFAAMRRRWLGWCRCPLGTEGFDYADPRERGMSEVDTRLDLADRIADLPQDLFALARDLLAASRSPRSPRSAGSAGER